MKCLLPIFLLITVVGFGQTYSDTIPDKDVIDFITWKLNPDNRKTRLFVDRKIITIDKSSFLLPDSLKSDFWANNFYLFKKDNHLDSLFSDADITFLISQAEKIKSQVWELKLKRIKLETPTSFHPDHTTWSYSIPYFSADRKKVIIIEAFYCAVVCGGGAYFIYKKKDDNTWEFIKKVNEWAE